jgi:hypothetical protein
MREQEGLKDPVVDLLLERIKQVENGPDCEKKFF